MKLTQVQAQELITQANKDVKAHNNFYYRFGQALFNILPRGLAEPLRWTDNDFFHEKMLTLFYVSFMIAV